MSPRDITLERKRHIGDGCPLVGINIVHFSCGGEEISRFLGIVRGEEAGGNIDFIHNDTICKLGPRERHGRAKGPCGGEEIEDMQTVGDMAESVTAEYKKSGVVGEQATSREKDGVAEARDVRIGERGCAHRWAVAHCR